MKDFSELMKVNMRLAPRTVKDTTGIVARFLKKSNYLVSYKVISDYLKSYLNKAPETYNMQIKSLRRFVRDFLHLPQLISNFKMAPVEYIGNSVKLPSKAQLRKGFQALRDTRAKAFYLFTATTGLRRGEILNLTKDKVDFKLRAVIPQHFTRVKRSGITFYNNETETWLNKYLAERCDNDSHLFVMSDRKNREIWRLSSMSADAKITPRILRLWFSMEMGEQGIPDRFVDLFQGRAPRSVLAKHYTAKRVERLKTIYDNADLNIL
jgi:integrase